MTERCIYLVRHGETVGESSIRYHGRNDVALSDIGRRQVEGLIPLVSHVPFAAVIHSPLSRARVSADILVDALKQPPGVVEEAPDLVEVDFGAIEGMTQAEIAMSLPDWFTEWKTGGATGFPGGETFAGFDARVGRATDGFLARHPVGNLLIVVHKGIIKRAVGQLLRMSTESSGKLDPDLGSLTVLAGCETGDARFELKHWSLTNNSK
jgi:broad specificity phosphatase PhoE